MEKPFLWDRLTVQEGVRENL
jgi:hypothetical protein